MIIHSLPYKTNSLEAILSNQQNRKSFQFYSMKTTKNPFLIAPSIGEQHNRIRFNRNQSLQMERRSKESLEKQSKENYLSSYPIFQATKSKILQPPLNQENYSEYQLERKKSSFLKNYNEKLKRQRKRQLKLKSSIKQLKTTKYPIHASRTINHQEQLSEFANKSNSHMIPLPDAEKRTTSILILRKTPFLDTSKSIFRQKTDYTKDSSLQLLLKEINEIKMEEKRQIQKISRHNLLIGQDSIKKKISPNNTKQNFFTKYQRGFLLPMRRKIGMGNGNMSKTSDILQNYENSMTKYGSREKIGAYKNSIDKKQLQKFYNFKQIDPWENPTQRQNHSSFDNSFLFNTVQN